MTSLLITSDNRLTAFTHGLSSLAHSGAQRFGCFVLSQSQETLVRLILHENTQKIFMSLSLG